MGTPDENEFLYHHNGALNASYILSQATALLRAGELEAAASLYRVLKKHAELSYCAYYGLGECYRAAQDFQRAVQMYEKSFQLKQKPFIAVAILEQLLNLELFLELEKRALEFAILFSQDQKFIHEFKRYYEVALKKRLSATAEPISI